MKPETNTKRSYGWVLLILLAAIFLRLHDIDSVPPGLTHDEADHGITAQEIVAGARDIYFTIGYGREPLYDYSTAAIMTFLGPSYLAGRLTAVFFSLILISAVYAWTRTAFDTPTALLTAAGLAVGFWAVMTSRQYLRSITLPAVFALSVLLYWRGFQRSASGQKRPTLFLFLLGGLFLGLSFYTYIPARVLWLVFPAHLLYLGITEPTFLRRVWRQTVMMLAAALIVGLPLFGFLIANPEAEARIRQLSAPMTGLLQGSAAPLLKNVWAGLGIFTFSGDSFWRYNIPGRPLLNPVLGALFYLGLLAALYAIFRRRAGTRGQTAFFSLAWLLAGLSPVLVTGPDLSTTQAVGMQPVIYLFPALGLMTLVQFVSNQRWQRRPTFLLPLMAVLLFAAAGWNTYQEYFKTWANAPEVRTQYETTLVTALSYAADNLSGDIAISTITPHSYHSPAVAAMILRSEAITTHWFDGRSSILLPDTPASHMLVPGFTPIHPALVRYLAPASKIDSLPMRPTDQDRPVDVYRWNRAAAMKAWGEQFSPAAISGRPVRFGDSAALLGYDLQTPVVAAGSAVSLAMLWRADASLNQALLFTHIQEADGRPLAQADQLDVPGELWQAGDTFIQLHQIQIPAGTPEGTYAVAVGLCVKSDADCRRQPFQLSGSIADLYPLTELTVTQ